MLYYTFKFGEQNAGWFEIKQTDQLIRMNAIFKMEGDEYENPYWVKLDDGKPVEYKSASCDWTKMPEGDNIFPEAAYPILVPQVKDRLTFISLHEDTGEILGPTTLVRTDNLVEETRDGAVFRRFWLEANTITKIDWGGPVSEHCDSLAEAKMGSDF